MTNFEPYYCSVYPNTQTHAPEVDFFCLRRHIYHALNQVGVFPIVLAILHRDFRLELYFLGEYILSRKIGAKVVAAILFSSF